MEQLVQAMNSKSADAVVACLAPDAVLRSPITRRVVFRGHEQIREILEVVYETISSGHVAQVVGDGDVRVLLVQASVHGLPIDETVVVRTGPDGLVTEMRLYVRAMPQLVAFAAAIGPPLARRRSRLRAALLWALFTPMAWMVRVGEPLGLALSGAGEPERAAVRPRPATTAAPR